MKILIKLFVKIIFKMNAITKSWKTTVIAVLTALFGILQTIGIVDLPPDVQQAIILIAIFLIGLTAADAKNKK